MEKLSLYIHWPFCESKCPYCDFNSHVDNSINQNQWASAYCTELNYFSSKLGPKLITSIFFGGGTPSLMTPKTVESIIDSISSNWNLSKDAEITLEANPSSVETNKFSRFSATGINRISLGVQALDNNALKFLGRQHSLEEALTAIKIAQKEFSRFSFDLIYARPDQTVSSWKAELKEAVKMTDTHLSVYQLTIEPGTQFYKDRISSVDQETGANLYELTQEILEASGLPAYEISNHAQPGFESKHNLNYWNMGAWLGIGPGAHSRLRNKNKTTAFHHWRSPNKWMDQVEEKGHGTAKLSLLPKEEDYSETIIMGLRLRKGISRKHFEKKFGLSFEDIVNTVALNYLVEENYIECNSSALRATSKGRECLNSVLAQLL